MQANNLLPLDEARRSAMVAYYLGKLVGTADSVVPAIISTNEDLYEYLLIDPLVTANVDTSRVAQGIASLQQHIHAIFNGMEPGFEQVHDLDHRQMQQRSWREAMSQYRLWAGYQMLADYPENYLDPTLRLGKTESFDALESELAQARLTAESVQAAVSNYLSRFEEISNLDIVGCYVDGLDFCHADYYFLGRQQVPPFDYYWRKAAIELDDDSTHVAPSAWSEWKKVDAAIPQDVVYIRPVVLEGRLILVWLECLRQALDAQKFIYALDATCLQLDGQWAVVAHLQTLVRNSPTVLESYAHQLMVSVASNEKAQSQLVIGLVRQNHVAVTGDAFLSVFDELWATLNLSEGSVTSLVKALAARFKGVGHALQYPLSAVDKNGKSWIVESVTWNRDGDNHIGPLSPYLELEVKPYIADGVLKLENRGVCNQPWYPPSPNEHSGSVYRTRFGVWSRQPRSPHDVLLNGAARTPFEIVAWDVVEEPVRFGMHDKKNGLGYNQFSIVVVEFPHHAPALVTNEQGDQFLDLQALGLSNLRYVRLNTTFAGELARRAERSSKDALGWEAQHTLESPLPGSNEAQPVDFNGANGRYFWELFFHVPHLVAWRLQQEFDYAGAEQWLHYLFNPQVRVAPLHPPPEEVNWLPYWVSRPLGFADDPSRDAAGPVDPDVIAYGAPSHYRKAIFTLYIDNLIAWGDSLYRQVTRDTLNEAKLLYVRALSLLGPLSKGRSVSQWAPASLSDAAAGDSESFIAAEANAQGVAALDVPPRAEGSPWLRLIDAPWFRVPVNTRLLDLWDQLDLRLYNLRHNLSLDGKALQLALYEAPANPLDLLRAQLAGSSVAVRRLGSMAIIPPYRFRALLPRAQESAATLMRFGEQVRTCLEARDRVQQEQLQQAHILELSGFVITLEEQAIDQITAVREGLVSSQKALESRIEYYDDQVARDVSELEKQADRNFAAAADLAAASRVSMAAGHAATSAPNTMVAVTPIPPVFIPGGWNWAGPFFAAASGLESSALKKTRDAQASLLADMRGRRLKEWAFLKHQAGRDREGLLVQIEQQNVVLHAAQTRLALSNKTREQAQSLYAFVVNRASGAALYQWLLSQMSSLYFQAYDAVLSLCLSTEASWQYEIGDGDTRFIPASAWADDRHGLTAGESLQMGLQQMEAAFLARHDRRLELTKTLSLRQLLAEGAGEGDDIGWEAVIGELRSAGTLAFSLKPSLFDRDYPGHYLRQLVQVTVSLPGVLGPYEDARLVLSQQSSHYLLKADLGGVRHLYAQAQEPVDGDADPRYVVANARSNQQVTISADRDDAGLHVSTPDESRYLPFEGTGAISTWTLSFPRHGSERQQALFEGLQDVIVQVRYRAMDGGKTFASQVKALVQSRSQRPSLVFSSKRNARPVA